MTLSEELTWRGFVNQTTYKDITALDSEPISFYWGVDPSADSMTIGNLAAAMMVKTLIKHGHKPVLLVGGATGLIGDPDGKVEERNLKSFEEVGANKQAIVAQYHQIFGNKDIKVVDNYDWFKDIDYLGFLREVGKHVSMRQMLAREFVQTRLGEDGVGVSYAEFSYVLIQAYDFLHLYEKHGVTLQVCGSDQWGNSIAGVDLIRRKTGGEAHVYSVPLIVNKSTGRKFGKSEEGTVWLDTKKTTPTQFYQFWVNAGDADVEGYLKIFTELKSEEVVEVMTTHQQTPEKRHAQLILARQVTMLVHGKEAMLLAENVTQLLTGRLAVGQVANDPKVLVLVKKEIGYAKVAPNDSVLDALVETGLAASRGEGRRLLAANAVSINGVRTLKEFFNNEDFDQGFLLLRRGKAFKDSALIELQ